jgi:hydrogenase expression/formation protein HypC
MCIAMPAQVVGVDGAGATVDRAGRRMRAATLMLPDVEVGEWVMVAAGAIVQRLAPDEALQIRDALLAVVRLGAGDQEGDPDAGS